ncbi:hypothetical protein NL676_020762 [Syzygium grande]|nr:hypothetical protein NL676_020762 [Syzygium grande]
MNSTSDYLNPEQNRGEFTKGIRFMLIVLALLILIKLACYICTHVRVCVCVPRSPRSSLASAENSDYSVVIALGLDDTTLESFPKLLYSQAKAAGGISGSSASFSCCSICLSDYKETDVLRMLPGCGHYFHLKCVDEWLRSNPSCPCCRNSLVPTPIRKLLADVEPLAASQL